MTVDLPALRKLLQDATPRPWRVESTTDYYDHERRIMRVTGAPQMVDYGSGPQEDREQIIETDCGVYGPKAPDADLLTAAVNSLEPLLDLAAAAQEWHDKVCDDCGGDPRYDPFGLSKGVCKLLSARNGGGK